MNEKLSDDELGTAVRLHDRQTTKPAQRLQH